jgi:hypothetical protein
VNIGPDAALVDHIPRPIYPQDLSDPLVLINPIQVADLQLGLASSSIVKNDTYFTFGRYCFDVLGIVVLETSARCRPLFSHRTHVQDLVFYRGPLGLEPFAVPVKYKNTKILKNG